MGFIYKLTFANGKSYIGQTVRTLQTRLTAHKNAAARGSLLAVHCAWREHGAPTAVVLCAASDELLHELERAAIISHGTKSPGGYNVSDGGDTSPMKSPEVAAKVAAKALGRKWTEEKKAQMAEAMRLRWQDPGYRALVHEKTVAAWASPEAATRKENMRKRAIAMARPHTEEFKQMLRDRVVSQETRLKMSASAKNRGAPTAAIKRSAEANRGRITGPCTEARKAAVAAGVKAAWADPEKRERLMAARKTAWETRRNRLKD